MSDILRCTSKLLTNHSPQTSRTRFSFHYLFSSQPLFSESVCRDSGRAVLFGLALERHPWFNDNSYFYFFIRNVCSLSDHLSWHGCQADSDFYNEWWKRNISLGPLSNVELLSYPMDFGSTWKYEIRDPNFGLCHITLKLITWPTDHNTLSDVKGVNHGDKPSDNSASATPQLSSPFCSVEYFNFILNFNALFWNLQPAQFWFSVKSLYCLLGFFHLHPFLWNFLSPFLWPWHRKKNVSIPTELWQIQVW